MESLRFNHPYIEVINGETKDFLVLLKEWENFCEEINFVETRGEMAQHKIDSEES